MYYRVFVGSWFDLKESPHGLVRWLALAQTARSEFRTRNAHAIGNIYGWQWPP